MGKTACRWASGATLLVGMALVAKDAAARRFDELAEAREDLGRLARLFADARGGKPEPAKVKAITEAMRKKYEDLGPIMAVYKARKKNSDSRPSAARDGFEFTLQRLAGRKEISGAELARDREALLRIANLNLALYEVNTLYAPTLRNGPRAKLWAGYNDAMRDGSEALRKAVQANDPVAVKKAAVRITAACNDCHGEFR